MRDDRVLGVLRCSVPRITPLTSQFVTAISIAPTTQRTAQILAGDDQAVALGRVGPRTGSRRVLDGMTKFGRADWSIAGEAAYRTRMTEYPASARGEHR